MTNKVIRINDSSNLGQIPSIVSGNEVNLSSHVYRSSKNGNLSVVTDTRQPSVVSVLDRSRHGTVVRIIGAPASNLSRNDSSLIDYKRVTDNAGVTVEGA